jgi:hypothetical protein
MNTIPSVDEPIFTRDAQCWHPHAEAAGVHSGLHGGAISGLVVADMEREAREQGLGLPLSASVLLIRPGPLAPLETHTEVLRKGGRVGVLETTLLADGQVIAKGTASFVVPRPVEGTPAVTPTRMTLRICQRGSAPGAWSTRRCSMRWTSAMTATGRNGGGYSAGSCRMRPRSPTCSRSRITARPAI